jgi:hypothetical protein
MSSVLNRIWITAFLLLFYVCQNSCYAEQTDDSTRILRCRNFFNLTSSFTRTIFSTSILNADDNAKLKYRTSNPFRFGIAFDYRWFGIELGLNVPVLPSQKTRKGETKTSSFRFSVNGRRITFMAQYTNFHGFYLNNDQFIYNFLSKLNPLPKRPDMLSSIFQTNILYYFNHNQFSNPAAVGQYERQIKSGGSPLAGLGVQFYELTADSSFIPKNFKEKFPNLSQIKSITGIQSYFTIGYIYSFILKKKWFLTLAASPSFTRFQSKETLFDASERLHWDLGFRFESRLVFGHNGERLYYGAWHTGFWTNERLLSGNYLDQTMQTFRFFCGLRFKTRRSLGFLGL